MNIADVPMDRLLASVRSVVAGIPDPRPPADERDPDGWQRVGAFEIRFDDDPRSAPVRRTPK